MTDTIENIEGKLERMSKEWDVDIEVLRKRADLAMKHKREIIDLCATDDRMWHFEDYFSDLHPHVKTEPGESDYEEKRAEADARFAREKQAIREMLEEHNKMLSEKYGICE